VVLCREGGDEILGIKRVGWNVGEKANKVGIDNGSGNGRGSGKASTRAVVRFPGTEAGEEGNVEDGRKFDVWVVSDGYVGMVWKVSGVDVPDVMRVVDEGKEKKKGDGEGVVDGEMAGRD